MSGKRARSEASRAMPCLSAASERIMASVRPGIGMPRNASGTENSSSNARAIARAPAPPVSTSVPSMSKRTSLVATLRVSGFGAYVSGARTFRRRFLFEADALSFVELVEATRHRTAMEEPLLPAVVANESESPVSNESLDRTCRHPNVSLGANVCPKSSTYQTSFHLNLLQVFAGLQPGIEPEAWPAHENAHASVQKRRRGRKS